MLNDTRFSRNMKKICFSVLFLAAVVALPACQSVVGSVSNEAVQEMLASPRMAVTPFLPAWLDEDGTSIWPLTQAQQAEVCAILVAGEAREVPELAYQTDDERDSLAKNRFYIYGSNGQCLAGTVMNDRVVMHDVVLRPEQEQALFRVLKPNLQKLFKGIK